MKQKFLELYKDKLIHKYIKVFIFLTLINIGFTVWKMKQLPPQVPLFYSLPRSNDQLASPFFFLMIPVFSIFFFFANFFISSMLYNKEKIACYVLIIMGTILTFLLTTTYIKIFLLIT